MLFRYRRYLPHLENPSGTYFVTFRLSGSVPKETLEKWKGERDDIRNKVTQQERQLSIYEKQRMKYVFSQKIEAYLDAGRGECWLRNPIIAQLVTDSLLYFNGRRYDLHAWCIMPNHVHVVFTVLSNWNDGQSDLIPILHSWKSFTAHRANQVLVRRGQFWEGEYYDHLIRGDEDFGHYVHYTLENPVKAGLCSNWREWPWSGCSQRIRDLMES